MTHNIFIDMPEDPNVKVFSDISDHELFQVLEPPTVRGLEKAYRRLAKVMHPDKYGGSEWATKAFKRLLHRCMDALRNFFPRTANSLQ